jgi:hypothetical protein
MASEISAYLANKILNWIKGTAFGTAPTAIYVALYSSDPGVDGTGGTDVTTTIRTAGRVAVTFGAVASRAIANSADVDFGTAAGGATVSHFGLWDASTAGNCIGTSPLTASKTVATGDAVSFPTGSLTMDFN